MIFHPTILEGSYTIQLEPVSDSRGWFARYYCQKEFGQIGHKGEWVQMNHSFSKQKGTLRGMHFQVAPSQEIKLVRCVAGAVYDVIVDLRKGSPTFLKWISVELSSTNRTMVYIPAGFAHGFQALTDDCELLYHHTAFFDPAAERGLKFDDPRISIQWPLPVTVISDRDNTHPYTDENFKGI